MQSQKQLKDFKKEVDALIETKDMKKDDSVLREYIKHSKKNPFEGDGYSEGDRSS
jgi:glutamine synthetase